MVGGKDITKISKEIKDAVYILNLSTRCHSHATKWQE